MPPTDHPENPVFSALPALASPSILRTDSMRHPALLILLSSLVLSACGKQDLETEPEPTPAPAPAPTTPPPGDNLAVPGNPNPFRVPDATSKLPEAKDTRAVGDPSVAPPPQDGDTATVTVRPPAEAPAVSGNTE